MGDFLGGAIAFLGIFNYRVDFQWAGYLFALFYLVWLLNLYNFMDGIDGLASVEAVFVCCGGALLYLLAGQPEYIWGPIILACATLGFLFWNFPPAKIFMGDAGSGFLGITLGAFSSGRWGCRRAFLRMVDFAWGIYRGCDCNPYAPTVTWR